MLGKYANIAMSVLLPSLTSVAAQSSGAAASSTSSARSSASTKSPKTYRVNVGAGTGRAAFSFDPNVTYAAVGEIVQFVFVSCPEWTGSDACGPGGCNPCVPYEIIHGSGGFHSGNQQTQEFPDPNTITKTTKTWNYTVETLDPVFYYCNALGSCHPNGMVGVINPNELVSIAKQIEAAKAAPYQLAPGQAWPAEGATPGAESATVSGLVQPTATNTSVPNSSNNNNNSSHHLSGGAIAGIVIGAVFVLALAAALFYFIGRSKTYKDMFQASKSETGGTGASQMGDHAAQVVPPPGGLPSSPGYPPNQARMSQMTQYSQPASEAATFVGYNRQTGAPEFASEAPISEHGRYQYGSTHGSPQPPQGEFGQGQTPTPQKRETFELAAETPVTPQYPTGPHEKQ